MLLNQQIEKSENELRMMNAAKNKFFSIIAHDLKGPFSSILRFNQIFK